MGTEGEDDGPSMEALSDDVINVSNGSSEDAVNLPKKSSRDGKGRETIRRCVCVCVCVAQSSSMIQHKIDPYFHNQQYAVKN